MPRSGYVWGSNVSGPPQKGCRPKLGRNRPLRAQSSTNIGETGPRSAPDTLRTGARSKQHSLVRSCKTWGSRVRLHMRTRRSLSAIGQRLRLSTDNEFAMCCRRCPILGAIRAHSQACRLCVAVRRSLQRGEACAPRRADNGERPRSQRGSRPRCNPRHLDCDQRPPCPASSGRPVRRRVTSWERMLLGVADRAASCGNPQCPSRRKGDWRCTLQSKPFREFVLRGVARSIKGFARGGRTDRCHSESGLETRAPKLGS